MFKIASGEISDLAKARLAWLVVTPLSLLFYYQLFSEVFTHVGTYSEANPEYEFGGAS